MSFVNSINIYSSATNLPGKISKSSGMANLKKRLTKIQKISSQVRKKIRKPKKLFKGQQRHYLIDRDPESMNLKVFYNGMEIPMSDTFYEPIVLQSKKRVPAPKKYQISL